MNPSKEIENRYNSAHSRRHWDNSPRSYCSKEEGGRFSGHVYEYEAGKRKNDTPAQLFAKSVDTQSDDPQHWKQSLPDLRDLLHSNRLERKISGSEQGSSYPEREERFSGIGYKHKSDIKNSDYLPHLFAKSVDPLKGDADKGIKDLIPANSSERKRKRSPSEEGRYFAQEANNSFNPPPTKRRRVPNDSPCFLINKKLASAKDTSQILSIWVNEKDCFNYVNIATACHRLAKLHKGRMTEEIENILSQLASSAVQKIGDFEAQSIANTAWAFATLGIRNESLFTALANEAVKKIRDFKSQNISNTAWAFATLGIRNDSLFTAIAREAEYKIGDFEAQNIANTAWAFAALGIRNESLFTALAGEALYKIRDFYAQGLTNTAWAFATTGIKNDSLFIAIAREAEHKIKDFKEQEIANTAWGFATLRILDDSLFAALSKEAQNKIRDFKAQEIANTAWSFARLGILDDSLLAALSKEAQNKMRDFNAQEIANTVWSFAILGFRNESLFSAFSREAVQKIRDFKPQDVASTVFWLAKFRIRSDKLIAALAKEAQNKMKDFNAQEIASTALSFAKLGIRNEPLCAALAKEAQNKMKDFWGQAIANTAWGLSVLGYTGSDFFNMVKNQIKTTLPTTDWSKESLRQLGQVALHIKYEMNEKSFSWQDALNTQIIQAQSESQSVIHSSHIQKESSRHLSLMGVKTQDEYVIDGLVVDICCPEINTLIEIDGPTHFAVGSHEPLGHTLFKQRILKAMGWTVLNIPYWEWDALHDDAAKESYLKQKLYSKQ